MLMSISMRLSIGGKRRKNLNIWRRAEMKDLLFGLLDFILFANVMVIGAMNIHLVIIGVVFYLIYRRCRNWL
jgi:hypothetical protein